MMRKILVYIVIITLFVGTSFGFVSGSVTEETEVIVGVNDSSIDDIWIHDYQEDIGHDDSIKVSAVVDAIGHENSVDEVIFQFEYLGDLPGGNAITFTETVDYEGDWGFCPEIGESGDHYENSYGLFKVVIDEPESMWRYGEWGIRAIGYDHDGEETQSETEYYNVMEYLEIAGGDNGIAKNISLENQADEFVDLGTKNRSDIEISSNSIWGLSFDEGKAVHEEYSSYSLNITGEYEKYWGYPTHRENLKVYYETWIPYGYIHGTYSTEHGESAIHLLENIDDEFDQL